MQDILFVSNSGRLYALAKSNGSYSGVNLNGKIYTEYTKNNLSDKCHQIVSIIFDEYNNDEINDYNFFVLNNAESEGVRRALINENINSSFVSIKELEGFIDIYKTIIKKEPSELAVYGINFGDRNYKMINDSVLESDFDLLAVSVTTDNLIETILK